MNVAQTFTHAGRLQDVATVAVAVELGSVELKDSALRLVVQCNCNKHRTLSTIYMVFVSKYAMTSNNKKETQIH